MVGSPAPIPAPPNPLKIFPQLYLRPWEEERGVHGQKLPLLGASPSWAGQGVASEPPPRLVTSTRPFVAIATPAPSNLDGPESQFSAKAGENVSLRSSVLRMPKARLGGLDSQNPTETFCKSGSFYFLAGFFLSHPNPFFLG